MLFCVLSLLLFILSGKISISFQSNFKQDILRWHIVPKMACWGIAEIKNILQHMLQVSQNFAILVLQT